MKKLSLLLCVLALFASPVIAVEERIGSEILLDVTSTYVSGGPVTASDGLGAFVVWVINNELRGARIDGAGNVSGPYLLATGTTGRIRDDPAVASSGHGALVAWAEEGDRYKDVNVILLDADGRSVHSGPLTIDRSGKSALHVHAAFDGFAYHVLWQRFSTSKPRNFTQRVGTDGSRWTRKTPLRTRGMTPYPYEPDIACLTTGQCLVTWQFSTGADRIQGVRLVGDKIIDRQVLDLMHNVYDHDVVAGMDQYLILGSQRHIPCGQSSCPITAGAARVSSDGTALDLDGVPVDNPPDPSNTYVWHVSGAFDGESYLTAFMGEPSASCAWNIFGAHIAADGTVTNPDMPGSAVSDNDGALGVDLAAIRESAVAVWGDQRDAATCAPYSPRSVRAQLVFPHAPLPSLPVRNIGAIGTLALAEEQVLRFTVGAPGLDPGTTSVSVANLPEGALFDEATRTFQWLPYPNQAGTHAGIHFEASDASQTISEDVTIEVAEGSLSLCGVVDLFGAQTPNVAIRLKGGGGRPRTVLSNSNGRFCFFHLIQAQYRIGIGKQSRRDFVADRLSWVVTDGDVDGVIVSVRQRSH